MYRELWFSFYIMLTVSAGVMIVWTMTLISHTSFLGIAEPPWMMHARRIGLLIIGLGILQSARWHFDTGRPPWLSELLMVGGLNLYLSVAICSIYSRLHRIGTRL